MENETTNGSPDQIYALMSKCMSDIKFVAKTRENQQQHYAFRGIDEIYAACQPILVKHGVIVIPEVTARIREERETKSGGMLFYTILTVKHTFYAPDGSSVVATTIGEAMDSGDKSSNKAMSTAMKYALIESFAIPANEPIDTEMESPEVIARREKDNGEFERRFTDYGDLNDAEQFKSAVYNEFMLRDFIESEIKSALAAFGKTLKLKKVSDATFAQRQKFIADIYAGKLDNFHKVKKQTSKAA